MRSLERRPPDGAVSRPPDPREAEVDDGTVEAGPAVERASRRRRLVGAENGGEDSRC